MWGGGGKFFKGGQLDPLTVYLFVSRDMYTEKDSSAGHDIFSECRLQNVPPGWRSAGCERYTSVRIFRAPILNSLLVHAKLCLILRFYLKKFYWAIIGGDTIVPRILRLRRLKNFQQAR
jgi:hypothetical protein